MKPLLALFVVFFALTPIFAQAQMLEDREVWFALRTDGRSGTGTHDDPFDGSGTKLAEMFAHWDSNASNLTIRLGPGTYLAPSFRSRNGLQLPLNSRLIGSGMHSTVIVSTNITSGFWSVVHAKGSVQSRSGASEIFHVSDLTLDARFNQNAARIRTPNKAYCIDARSARNTTIERVRAIGYGVQESGEETFPIRWQLPADQAGSYHVVDCIVEGPCQGNGYASLITAEKGADYRPGIFDRSSIIVRGCRLLGDPRSFGVNTAGVNVLVENNDFQNLAKGFNLDTGWGHRVVIRNNRMRDVSQGVYIGCWEEGQVYGASDWVVEKNSILVGNARSGTARMPNTGIFINGWITNLVVADNRIGVTGALAGTEWTNRFGILMARTTGANQNSIRDVQLIGNRVANELLSVVMSGGESTEQVVCTIDNMDLANPGRFARGFPEKSYIWSANRAGDIQISESLLTRGLPEIHVAYSRLHRDSRIVLPQPSTFRGQEFRLTVSRHASDRQPGCATIAIQGQTSTSTDYLDDPSPGRTYSTRTQPGYFFDTSVQKFCRVFQMFCGDGPNRYGAYRLYSDGDNWIVSR